MDKRNNVRLIIWGLLFIIFLGCGGIGFSISKARERANPYNDDINYNYEDETDLEETDSEENDDDTYYEE